MIAAAAATAMPRHLRARRREETCSSSASSSSAGGFLQLFVAEGQPLGVRIRHPAQQRGQPGEAGQLFPAVEAVGQVGVHDRALGWVDRAQDVNAEGLADLIAL